MGPGDDHAPLTGRRIVREPDHPLHPHQRRQLLITKGHTMDILIYRGDITKLSSSDGVGAVVNAASPSLLGGGGVDGAIHAAAGPGLLEECRALGGCEVGDAKITGAHGLDVTRIVHAVGPDYRNEDQRETAHEKLASTYRRALEVAASAGVTTIVFPAISTGIYGFPKAWAADIAVRTLALHGDRLRFEKIVLAAFTQEDADILLAATQRLVEVQDHASFIGGTQAISGLADDYRLAAAKHRGEVVSDLGDVFEAISESLVSLVNQNITQRTEGTDTSRSSEHYVVLAEDEKDVDERIAIHDDSDDAAFAAIRRYWHDTLREHGQPEDKDPVLSFQRPAGGAEITVRIIWPEGEHSVEHWVVR